MSFPEAVQTVLTQKYADFSGRARRSEYWWFYLAVLIAYAVFEILAISTGLKVLFLLLAIVALALFIPTLAVSVRRLHDTGRSGWWVLIPILPIIGTIILIVFLATDSTPGDNQYGPSPKGQGFAQPIDPNAQWG